MRMENSARGATDSQGRAKRNRRSTLPWPRATRRNTRVPEPPIAAAVGGVKSSSCSAAIGGSAGASAQRYPVVAASASSTRIVSPTRAGIVRPASACVTTISAMSYLRFSRDHVTRFRAAIQACLLADAVARAAAVLAEIDVQMVGMRGVAAGPEHGEEVAAGGGAERAEKGRLGGRRPRRRAHGEAPAVAQD